MNTEQLSTIKPPGSGVVLFTSITSFECSLKSLQLHRFVREKALHTNILGLEKPSCGSIHIFIISGLGKTDRPKHIGPPIVIPAFTEDPRIDPVYFLNCYVRRTEKLRVGTEQLFISIVKPHNAVSVQTISRWLVNVLNLCGISFASGHSTRSTGASTAAQAGVNVDTILAAADWSGPSTFKRFYYKPVIDNVSHSILKSTV